MNTTNRNPGRVWSTKTAIEQIGMCGFECEAGPLTSNAAWQWLIAAAQDGPEFMPGQCVWFEAKAEVNGLRLLQWLKFHIVGCEMSSDTERCNWTYSLSCDPPGPWHYGTTHFRGIRADRLRLTNPALEGAI